MKISTHILLAAGLGACSFDTSAPALVGPDGSAALEDAGESMPADADLPVEGRKHLLLTEVKTTGSGTEFIEIYNPSDERIALGDYYLTDTKSAGYLPGAFGSGPRPSVIMSDFMARFPQCASIEPGEAQVVAIKPNDFAARLGSAPDYQISGDAGAPEMRTAFPSSISALTTLTDSGEVVTLFYWDGESDLIVDVDIVNAGAETTPDNGLAVKTNVQVDGPDAGSVPSTYQKDLGTMSTIPGATDGSQSYQRTAPETSREAQSAGNGLFGHDETSEDIALTWTIGNPSPGTVAAGL